MADNEAVDRLDQSLKLKEAFVVGSHEDKYKQGELKRQNKIRWLRDRILIKILDERGDDMAGCSFYISRRSLTRQFLQMKVNDCPRPCIVDYVYDNTGQAISIEDMQQNALPSPAFYVIVPEVIKESYDILNFTNYDGKTGVFLHFVPLYCDDRSHEVDEITLLEWVTFAILESDVSIEPYLNEIARSKNRLKGIKTALKSVETKKLFDENNNLLEGAAADKERNYMYDTLSNDLLKEELELKKCEDERDQFYERRKSQVKIRFEREPLVESKLEVCTWRMFIIGAAEEKARLEHMIIDKKDWSGIRLASHSAERELPAWAGRTVVPVGKSALHPDYSGLEVKISSVQFNRVPHGVGVYRALDRQSSSVAADKFGLFYGKWSVGKKNGPGLEINDVGVYAGNYVDGFRRGNGRLDYGDGTSVVGEFSVHETRASNPLGGFENPYLDGEANGVAEILFSDGGLYRGEVVDGRIEGNGEYQSGFGDVMKGNFYNGSLKSEGSIKMHDDQSFEGVFQYGELSGYGKYSSPTGDSYDGEFYMGLPHGRGKAVYAGLGEYSGFHTWGMRSGKGDFHYGVPRTREKATSVPAKTEIDVPASDSSAHSTVKAFKYVFHGYLLADKIAPGGLVMTGAAKVPRSISQRIGSIAKPLDKITKHLTRQAQRMRRNKEKLSFIENQIRIESVMKKHKIFRQQRHETKKAMYDDDSVGMAENILDVKYNARKGYTDYMSNGLARVLIPNASVENIEARNDYLKYVLDSIQPNYTADLDDLASSMELLQVAISDIEETAERQRFLKYDKLWERAEAAFIGMKENNS